MNQTRVVFTLAFGARRFGEMAMGLGRSLSLIGDGTPRAILTDIEGFDWGRHFDIVIQKSIPREDTYWAKFAALEYTSAQQVLFLDSDSLVFRRLDPVFEAFAGAAVGVQAEMVNSGRWYDRDIAEVCRTEKVAALPKMNGGLIYYERTPAAYRLLAEARGIGERTDETGFRRVSRAYGRDIAPDEPCIALAMAKTGIGRAVPDEADFMSTGMGLIGRLRMDVRAGECGFLCRRGRVRYIRPYVFHASRYSNFLIYWRQLRRLQRLDEGNDRITPGRLLPVNE